MAYPPFHSQGAVYEYSDLRKVQILRHQKAERWFKERRIKYQYIDLASKGVSAGEYRSIKAAVGSFDALVDKTCRAYEDQYMAYITPDAAEEKLLAYPELFAAPIVRNGRQATVGYHPEIWQTWE